MRSRFLLALALLALAAPSFAQQQDVQVGQLAYRYDLDATTFEFCKLGGINGDPYQSPIPGSANIKTTGTSTTVDAVSGTPFGQVGVGDVLISQQPDGVTETVIVTAATSNVQVEVDPAVDWENSGNGFPFSWYNLECGNTGEDGWVAAPPGQHAGIILTVEYDAGDLTGGLDVLWEARGANLGSQAVQVYPGGGSDCGGFATLNTDVCTLDTAQVGTPKARLAIQVDPNYFQQFRVGIKANTADPGDPTNESIDILVTSIR
jgi:hypothetical protein